MEEEPLVSRGVAATLRLLTMRGVLKKEKAQTPKPVQLEYKDEHGRTLTPKEAFKLLSHKFHGKTPGKAKTDKILQKIQTEKMLLEKSLSFSSTPKAMQMAEKTRAALGTAHVVVANSSLDLQKPDKKRPHDRSTEAPPPKKRIFGMR